MGPSEHDGRGRHHQNDQVDVSLVDLVDDAVRAKYQKVFTITDLDKPIKGDFSRFEAPYTLRVSASRPANDNGTLTLHFVKL